MTHTEIEWGSFFPQIILSNILGNKCFDFVSMAVCRGIQNSLFFSMTSQSHISHHNLTSNFLPINTAHTDLFSWLTFTKIQLRIIFSLTSYPKNEFLWGFETNLESVPKWPKNSLNVFLVNISKCKPIFFR